MKDEKNTKTDNKNENMVTESEQCAVLTTEDMLPYTLSKKSNDVHYNCKHCSFANKNLSRFMKHIRDDHPDHNVKRRGESIFKCVKCDILFNLHGIFVKHLVCHKWPNILKKYQCPDCEAKFEFHYQLRLHSVYKHTDDPLYKCSICFKGFRTQSHLTRHENNVHVYVKDYRCQKCDLEFDKKISLRNHVRSVHQSARFRCHLCSKKYMFEYGLDAHLKKHQYTSNLQCRICNKKFDSKNQLDLHQLTHRQNLEKMIFKCPICFVGIFREIDVREHFVQCHAQLSQTQIDEAVLRKGERLERVNGEIKDYNAEEQQMEENNAEERVSEDNERINIQDVSLQCSNEEDNIRESEIEKLYNHVDSDSCDSDDVPLAFKATNPQKVLELKLGPSETMEISPDLPNFPEDSYFPPPKKLKTPTTCAYCDLDLHSPTALVKHIRAVHNPVIYSCIFCEKSYLTKRYLNKHMRILHGSKDISCEICNKTFKFKKTLNQHLLTHSITQACVDCNHCLKLCSGPDDYKKHVLEEHAFGKSVYQCEQCPKIFFRSQSLKKHLTMTHKENLIELKLKK